MQSATYYDNLGRPIQTVVQNHKGGLDISTSKLDFVGRVLESRLTTANSSSTITVDNRTAYEQGGRVKSVCQKVSDNQPSLVAGATPATRFYWEPVARHTYNGIGELTTKTLGCGIQTIDYQYQMRGWLSQLNDPANLNQGALPSQKDFFGMKLAYDGVGNITTWEYSNAQTTYSPYGLSQKPAYQYGFTYDNLNRLTSGTLNQQGQTKFTLNGLTYDENGNITHLNRALGTATDNLSYSYKNNGNSNQLASVSDGGSADFAKSSSYAYDAVGNLIRDSGKGITSDITYNHLNLPKKVVYNGGEVTYTYSANGQKLKADFGGGKTYDYVGGLVYDKDGLEFIPTAEGRVLPPGRASTTVAIGASTSIIASNSFYRYEYHLKDHLGNLRAACRCGERQTETTPGDSYEPLVVQEQHYDPFGLDLAGLNSQPGLTASRLKYLDRELQPDLGWYDLQARFYNPSIGRFTTVDPVTENQEEYSTYQYSYNNPITKSDPDGKWPGQGLWNKIVEWFNKPVPKGMEAAADGLKSAALSPSNSKTTWGDVVTSSVIQIGKGYQYASDLYGRGGGFGAPVKLRNGANGGTRTSLTKVTAEVGKTADALKQAGKAPATVAGALAPNGSYIVSPSGKIPSTIAPQLEKSAAAVGGIGAKNAGNTVGCCGEFHSVNELLIQNPQYNVQDIQTTPAIRPRTGQVVPRCSNCETMFGPEPK